MSTISKSSAGLAALTMTAMLALSGCGNNDADASDDSSASKADETEGTRQWNYAFDNAKVVDQSDIEPVAAESNPFTISLPEELKKAAPQSSTKVLVKSYTVSTKAFDSGMCRADVTVNYEPGGQAAITTDNGRNKSTPEVVSDRLIGYGDPTMVSALPSDDDLSSDDQLYMTKDFTKLTVVDDCSEADSDDYLVDLYFPYLKGTAHPGDYLSDAEVTVFQGGQSGAGGSTTMVLGRTEAEVSANGSWQQIED